MVIFLIICVVVILIAIAANSSQNNYQSSSPVDTYIDEAFKNAISEPQGYVNKRTTIELKGVGPFYDREEAFNSVEVGDEVFIEWDTDNEYDDEAIGCYNQEGDLIGYLPAGRHKLIETFYTSKFIARVFKKWIEPSTEYGQFYRIKITLWMGFEDDELEAIKARWR